MGFKIAVLLIPLTEHCFAEAVSSVYGKRAQLKQCPETVDMVLYPDNQKKVYACEEGGNAWIFDWNLVPSLMDANKIPVPNSGLFYLHSVTNGYAFTIIKDSKIIRRRFGGSDEGIAWDDGNLLNSERKAIADAAQTCDFDKLKATWLDEEAILESADCEYTHDTLGEEIVFAVLENESGIHLSMPGERGERFYDQPVFEIKRPGFLSRLLG